MMYLIWALQAPILLLAYVFCWLTCWLWAGIAAVFKLDKLPGPLCWVHTMDDTIYGTAYLTSHSLPAPNSLQSRWTGAMWWICRNPAYGFAAYVLGFPDTSVAGIDHVPNDKWYIFRMTNGGTRFAYVRFGTLKLWFGWQPANQAGWHIMKFNVSPNPDD